MQEIVGNMWDIEADAYCITTNMIVKRDGSLVMGGGVARQAADRFPTLPTLWGKYYSGYMNMTPDEKKKFFLVQADKMEGCDAELVAFPTKLDYRNPSDLVLIMHAAFDLSVLANEKPWQKVIIPQPGCGLGGLQWDRVGPAIAPFLDERFYIITPK